MKFAGKHKTRTKKFGKANAKDKVEFGSLMLLNARRSLETLSKMYTYEEMMFNELEKIQKEMKDIK